MNNSCASTDGQSHNLFKLTKIGGIQPNFRNIAAHLPEYVDQSDLMQPIFLNMLTNQIRAWSLYTNLSKLSGGEGDYLEVMVPSVFNKRMGQKLVQKCRKAIIQAISRIVLSFLYIYFVSVAQFFAKLILSVAPVLYHKVF